MTRINGGDSEAPVIEAREVEVRFGDVRAVDGMSFSLDGGKIYGLLGRNGSGKTTLLSVLAAFRKATAGEVLVDGEPVFENPKAMRQICLIRESGDLDSLETVAEALEFAASVRPLWDATYALSLLDKFHIEKKKGLGALSRGQRSALGITLGLASRAPVTMFDESYLGLDAPSRYLFYDEVLQDFIAHPRTFIISTHLIEEVSTLFEEVLIIDKGKLVMHDSTEALRSLGTSVTGPAGAVDRFIAGQTVLGSRQLGRTKSSVVFGELDLAKKAAADEQGIDLSPIGLQDLFVHITDAEEATSGARS